MTQQRTRSAEIDDRHHAVARAAVRDLADEGHGYPILLADVADRTGISLPTLESSWTTSSALVIDALGHDAIDPRFDLDITGDLRRDLTRWAELLVTFLRTPRGLIFLRTIVDAASDPDEAMTPDHPLVLRRLAEFQQILDAADVRELDVRDVLDGLVVPIYLSVLTGSTSETDRSAIERSVDRLVRIAASRAAEDRVTGQPS